MGQRPGQVQEGRAVAQRAGLALHQLDVVLPVVGGVAAVEQPSVAGHDRIPADHVHPHRVQPRAHRLARPFARHRIAVAPHHHQASAGDPGQTLDIAVKRRGHAHEVLALEHEHLGNAGVRVLWMRRVSPECSAALSQPGVELGKAGKLPLARFEPDASTAVLHVLLHHALLPARGHVAEVRLEQIVTAHCGKAGVDHPPFALGDLVHGGLHVVVDPPAGHAAQGSKGTGVGIEQHFMALAGVGHQPEGPAGTQLQVRHLGPVVHPADHDAFFAPVELERLAVLEAQRHERARSRLARVGSPEPDEVGQRGVAAPIALRLQLHQQCLGRTPMFAGSVGIGLERRHQRGLERTELARLALPPVLGLHSRARLEPLLDRVPRQARAPGYLAV